MTSSAADDSDARRPEMWTSAISQAMAAGDVEKAAALVEMAKRSVPDAHEVRYAGSVVAVARQRLAEAEADIRAAVEASPATDIYVAQLALVLAKRGDLHGARDQLSTLHERNPANAEYAFHLANTEARIAAQAPEPEPAASDELEGGSLSVLEGDDGWLFLDRSDSVDVVGLYTDPDLVDEFVFESWARTLRKRREYFAERGITYLTMIVPDAHTVYRDKLPGDLSDRARSLVSRLDACLDEPVREQVVYPHQQLVDGRREAETYQSVDSHWTDWGAWLGYLEVARALKARETRIAVLEPEDVEWSDIQTFGSFGPLMTPERTALVPHAAVSAPRSVTTRTVMTDVRDGLVVTEQPSPQLPSAVIFRDSFMTAPAKFFSESFRRTVFCTSPSTILYDLVDLESPDVVIHEICERRLRHAPVEPHFHDFRWHFADLMLDHPAAEELQLTSRVMLRTGRPTEALEAIDSALDLVPVTARLLMHRARVLTALGRAPEALEALTRSVALDPGDSGAWFALALAHDAAEQLDEAISAAERAIEAEPRQVDFWSRAIAFAARSGDLDRAAELVDAAKDAFPDSDSIWFAASIVNTTRGFADVAERDLRTAIDLNPGDSTYAAHLAAVLAYRGDWQGAYQLLTTLQERHPENAVFRTSLEVLREKLGRG